ncbi:MAG: asparagine synthase (glutamine-hydrolyzing) [Alphaproteobacteria bacterium]|nr:asparagine synthase (glutamine-hydrolyzing) [Alphaproteobacteria bacterium]
MCGIAGYVEASVSDHRSPDELILNAIRYRGRDGEGRFSSDAVKLFHTRLSIIDLDGGSQPMSDPSGRYTIVFNGEIYNYLELRKRYTEAGYRFRSTSDTEVILAGFILNGEKVCSDLNGMFALAIWDEREKKLFLARDRLGKKPLYWFRSSGRLHFASSINAFVNLPDWRGKLSAVNMRWYMKLSAVPTGQTAFEDVFALPPASYAFIDPQKQFVSPTIYWRVNFAKKSKLSFSAARDELHDLLTDAIDIRLRADVPVCLTFSGGVDSGLIAAIATRRLGKSLKCWTLDYDSPSEPSQERAIAEKVTRMLDLDWEFKNFDYYEHLVSSIDDSLKYVDQPCSHIAISYSHRLYSEIGKVAKVALTGNGADELFLGYVGNEQFAHQDMVRAKQISRARLGSLLPGRIATRLGLVPPRSVVDNQKDYVRSIITSQEDRDIAESLVAQFGEEVENAGIETQADLYTWMALNYYTRDPNFVIPDIAGLTSQLELRSPFLDYRLVEFSGRLATHHKVDVDNPPHNKRILKSIYEQYVGTDIAMAKKIGMAGNLRYDIMFALDKDLQSTYRTSIATLAAFGIDCEELNVALLAYTQDVKSGRPWSPHAGLMTSAFMLARWLAQPGSAARVH